MPMKDLEYVSNSLVTEYRFELDEDWASFIVRQYTGKAEFEVEWLVGPILSKWHSKQTLRSLLKCKFVSSYFSDQ